MLLIAFLIQNYQNHHYLLAYFVQTMKSVDIVQVAVGKHQVELLEVAELVDYNHKVVVVARMVVHKVGYILLHMADYKVDRTVDCKADRMVGYKVVEYFDHKDFAHMDFEDLQMVVELEVVELEFVGPEVELVAELVVALVVVLVAVQVAEQFVELAPVLDQFVE